MKTLAPRDASLRSRTAVLKAMAHPSRLLILQELASGERCVCDLRELVGADISTVSKHLALLHNAGLVSYERRGTRIFYRLLCPCLSTFLECIDSVLAKRSRSRPRRQIACPSCR